MSLIKLAYQLQSNPIIVVNQHDDGSSSKSLNKRNIGAAVAGGTLGFAAKEAVDHMKGFNKERILHRYGSRMAGVGGAMLGASAVYSYVKHKNKDQSPTIYFM